MMVAVFRNSDQVDSFGVLAANHVLALAMPCAVLLIQLSLGVPSWMSVLPTMVRMPSSLVAVALSSKGLRMGLAVLAWICSALAITMPITCTLMGAGASIMTAAPAGDAAPPWPSWVLMKAAGVESGSPMSRWVVPPCSPR